MGSREKGGGDGVKDSYFIVEPLADALRVNKPTAENAVVVLFVAEAGVGHPWSSDSPIVDYLVNVPARSS